MRRSRQAMLLALAIVSFLPLQACSLFASSRQVVSITCSDAAADITVDGTFVGKGVAQPSLDRDRDHAVMARVGDRVGTATIGRSVSLVGMLDIVGGIFFLFPFLGLFGDGFWELDPQTIAIALPPAPAYSR